MKKLGATIYNLYNFVKLLENERTPAEVYVSPKYPDIAQVPFQTLLASKSSTRKGYDSKTKSWLKCCDVTFEFNSLQERLQFEKHAEKLVVSEGKASSTVENLRCAILAVHQRNRIDFSWTVSGGSSTFMHNN